MGKSSGRLPPEVADLGGVVSELGEGVTPGTLPTEALANQFLGDEVGLDRDLARAPRGQERTARTPTPKSIKTLGALLGPGDVGPVVTEARVNDQERFVPPGPKPNNEILIRLGPLEGRKHLTLDLPTRISRNWSNIPIRQLG